MSNSFENMKMRNRDGTAQTDRRQPALVPDYVSVDERDLKDLLAFAHEYAKELNFYDEANREQGDWSAFINAGIDLQEPGRYREYIEQAAAFARDPDSIPADRARLFARPHFALYLSFLRLLGTAQAQLNRFTQRHLEFYYQQILRMSKKTAVPDHVNVLLRPTPRLADVEVAEGHLLSAGRDSNGRDLFYKTERRIVVNHARIEQLSAVYAERQVTEIREAREFFKGTDKDAILNMLGVALGDPLPGDLLPEYTPGQLIDYDLLLALQTLIDFSQDGLFLEFFELRSLMRLKQQRESADDEWNQINNWLQMVGRARTGDDSFNLTPSDPHDFDANLIKALGGEPNFAGLTQVENIDDLYHQRTRQEVKDYIRDSLHCANFDDFVNMMQLKVKIDNEWKEINRLLELAGQRMRKDGTYRLIPEDGIAFDATDFATNFSAALAENFASLGVASIDEYYRELLSVERYFYMSAESFSYFMTITTQASAESSEGEWDKVYDILAESYRAKVYTWRRLQLKHVFETPRDPVQGLQHMIYYALGEVAPADETIPIERLSEYVVPSTDYEIIETAATKIKTGNVGEINLEQLYRIVELAQRYRERLPEPVARIQRWINLHPHADATAIQAEPDNPRWHTFGEALTTGKETIPPENMGWAIGSPLLLLSAGQRQITLTLGFDAEFYDTDKIQTLFPNAPVLDGEDTGPFHIQISSGEEWVCADTIEIRHDDYFLLSGVKPGSGQQPLKGLQFILNFSEQLDPITAPVVEAGVECDWPVLRLMLRQHWDAASEQYLTKYAPFEELQLLNAHLQVQVGKEGAAAPSGLSEIQIQNDTTVLDAKKPFHPFGTSPGVGSRFYLVHPELNYKRLDKLSFGIDWMGVPANLKTHYANYVKPDIDWTFKTRVSMVDRRVAYELAAGATLFATGDASQPHTISITDVGAALGKTKPGYKYQRSLEVPAGSDFLQWGRYLQWELTPLDFQHQNYPIVATSKSVQMAADIANPEKTSIVATEYQVSPPYTPKIKAMDLHYTASTELSLSDYVPHQTEDQIFHIHPFGYNEAHPNPAGGCWFLPRYSAEGELYIGIAGARPPQYLSVLFQMAEGSANPDRESVSIEWSYLSGDRWLSLAEGGIRLDTTRGLINSGIIEFELKQTEPNTRLPRALYWIRASISHHSDSVCDTVAIHAQAVTATLLDEPYAPDHYNQPLAADSIKGLSPPIAGIAELLQPYTSFGGKAAEQDEIFYTRISERLRHKQRALTVWDYERLVLERFPQIYKVKCLPADAASEPDQAGRLSIVVIPDIRNRLPFDPFAPKAPTDLIADIEGYLADKIPAYARVKVRNAHFVPVKVRVGVCFKEGYDIGFYKARLIRDLNHFLSPWAYHEGADIVIGGRIYANSIINFLDQRDYVDYVAAIKLFSSEDGRNFRYAQPQSDTSQGYYVSTPRSDGVLVAAHQHEIDVISKAGYEEEQFTGINYMKVELDFVVGE